MGARTYRPPRDDHVTEAGEMKQDYPHTIAMQQLLPRIDEKNKRAVKTVQTPVFFFSKIQTGRRCSCWTVDSSPDSLCVACYGTGVVGGYAKYGTYLEVVDVTHPNTRTVNVLPDYSRKSKPIYFTLTPGAKEGTIITRIELKTNIGTADVIKGTREVPMGGEMSSFIQAPTDPEPVPFTKQSFEQRLTNPWLDIRVDMTRPSVKSESPKFGLFYIRYNRLEEQILLANIPRTQKSNLLAELGISDDWQHQKFFFDSTLRSVTTEDFLVSAKNKTRWKINNVDESNPGDYLLSWDLDTRLVQHYEPTNYVPT